MSDLRPELNGLEDSIYGALLMHQDTSLASFAGRGMLARELASTICPSGIDINNMQHFYRWLNHGLVYAVDDIQRDWLSGLLNAVLSEIEMYGYCVLVPLGEG